MEKLEQVRVNVLTFNLTLNNLNKTSNDVPLEGLGHRLVVAAGDLLHEVRIEVLSDLVDGIDSGSKLILLLSADIEDPVGVLAPLALNEVPYLLNRVQLAALQSKELVDEPFVVELLLDDLAVVDAEVVHHNNPLM